MRLLFLLAFVMIVSMIPVMVAQSNQCTDGRYCNGYYSVCCNALNPGYCCPTGSNCCSVSNGGGCCQYGYVCIAGGRCRRIARDGTGPEQVPRTYAVDEA